MASSLPCVAAPLSSSSRFGSLPRELGGSSPSLFLIRTWTSRNLQVRATGNTFGNFFRVTTFGESHGGGVGCIVDGCPPRMPLSEADIQAELDRRRPGQSRITSTRKETDTCKIYSGVSEGVTTGTPIMISVPNTDQRAHDMLTDIMSVQGRLKLRSQVSYTNYVDIVSVEGPVHRNQIKDYNELSLAYRPSHADATYDMKYGVRAIGGGGRSSARETIGRVASGAIAKKLLKEFSGTEILAYVSQAHEVVLPEDLVDQESVTFEQIESNIVRCPDAVYAEKMIAAIDAARVTGDSVGGVVSCIARNVPRGLGSPVFDKLEALLAGALLSLPATMGFEFGSGFAGTRLTGSQHNDEFYLDGHRRIRTRTNRSGGIQGGISNGEVIYMRVAFKPTPTIGRKQNTVTRDKKETELMTHIRFDPCVAPRAVPIVEAMVALVLVDQLMSQYAQCYLFPINPNLQETIAPPQTWNNEKVKQHF